MAPAMPDGWSDYKPVGRKIEGTRFIAFKVPLKQQVSKTVDKDLRLDAKILLQSIPNLGLIIDLTNTQRYYKPYEYTSMGIEYQKLMIPGRVTPDKILSDKFIQRVNEYLQNNPDNDKLIGVHCTHGVNRTGYMICNYMISEMGIEPNEAISRFTKARGHKIERNNYVKALLETNMQLIPQTSNRRKRGNISTKTRKCDDKEVEISAKFNNWRIRDEVPAKPSNWRNINEDFRGDRYDRKSKPAQASKRNNYDSRERSSNRYSKKYKSSEADTGYGYDSSRRSPNRYSNGNSRISHNAYNRISEAPQQNYNTGNNDKYHYQIDNQVSRNGHNNHVPISGDGEDGKYRKPVLRTDYYSNSNKNLQRYKYKRN